MITSCVSVCAQPVFTQNPSSKQLYARNLANNLAAVPFSGSMSGPGTSTYVIKRFRYPDGTDLAGSGIFEANIPLPLSGNFSLSDFIPAGLVNYRYQVYQVLGPGNEVPVGSDIAREVVSGDAYLVYGQSNAEAGSFDALISSSPINYIRAIGTRRIEEPFDFATWAVADGDQYSDFLIPGSIGQWPWYVGKRIVESFQVPVAFLSYPRSGAQIFDLLRNDSDPTDINTPYGRLLRKVNASGLKNSIRGILYFQGEGDASANASTLYYIDKFNQLYADWQEDFTGFEKVITFQIRPGGVSQNQALEVQQAQVELAKLIPNVEVISTNHTPHFTDNVHYGIEGYTECGKRMFSRIKENFYNTSATPDEFSPRPVKAARGSAGKILIQLEPANASFAVDAAFTELVRLEGSGDYTTTNVEIKGSILEVTYTKTGSDPLAVSILGKEGPKNPSLFTALGVGILSVKNLLIESTLPIYFNYLRYTLSGNVLNLSWEIENNELFDRFEIEVSSDGRNWQKRGDISSNPGKVSQYGFQNIALQGARFVRVIGLQKDGSQLYSNILAVSLQNDKQLWGIYPNPVNSNSVLYYFADHDQQVVVKLNSLDGKQLIYNKLSFKKGYNSVPVFLPPGIAKGIYLVRLETSMGVFNQKIVH
jgi:hypothetical protein